MAERIRYIKLFRFAFHIDLTQEMLQRAEEKISFVLQEYGLKV